MLNPRMSPWKKERSDNHETASHNPSTLACSMVAFSNARRVEPWSAMISTAPKLRTCLMPRTKRFKHNGPMLSMRWNNASNPVTVAWVTPTLDNGLIHFTTYSVQASSDSNLHDQSLLGRILSKSSAETLHTWLFVEGKGVIVTPGGGIIKKFDASTCLPSITAIPATSLAHFSATAPACSKVHGDQHISGPSPIPLSSTLITVTRFSMDVSGPVHFCPRSPTPTADVTSFFPMTR
mmetsp:Transcript_32297/g.71469  ORF Transcript_32297/g.71469 Transcript_32297/m.71469 type:complete len:236 (-) Transcript_32297:652-1359(-)